MGLEDKMAAGMAERTAFFVGHWRHFTKQRYSACNFDRHWYIISVMVNLAQYNTLRVPAKLKDLMLLKFPKDLKKLRVDEQYMFLGLGANVLFVHDFPGTIISGSKRPASHFPNR